MPNYVYTTILIDTDKDKCEEVLEFVKSEHSLFDFNNIIPMPNNIKNTKISSFIDYAIDLLKNDDRKIKNMLTYRWENAPTELSDFKLYLLKLIGKESIMEGMRHLENEEEYGFRNWHSWSCYNWGTKWNSLTCEILENTIKFITAWDIPMPVLIKLSEIFHNVKFVINYWFEDDDNVSHTLTLIDTKIFNQEQLITNE